MNDKVIDMSKTGFGGPQPKMNFSLKDTTELLCTCGNSTFSEAQIFRVASRILTGGPKDAIVPIPVFICTACGETLQQLLPPDLQTTSLIKT